MTRGPRAALTAAIAALALVTASPALADTPTNPFSPGIPSSATTPTATTPTASVPATSTNGDSSLSGGAAVGIGIGAIALLGVIGLLIFRDARRHAPARTRAVTAGGVSGSGEGRPGSKRPPKSRKLSPAERRRRKRGRAR
jgi:hypothetical protein